MIRAFSKFLILAALLVPPGLAIAQNRFKPDTSTALNIPYAFLAGILMALVVALVFAVLSRRWPALRPHYLVIVGASAIAVVVGSVAERGLLPIAT